ncbi:glycosyltransferase family 39 protein [Algoriphagus marinus]|uniref:glycosyltransferase family 39 protein n=1 Tax=Algoriphagus marinus TaxID=1925762 RepID=UPI00094BB506|nr:glycosyltransferase family 39 protein [Algoriphagus marinus]
MKKSTALLLFFVLAKFSLQAIVVHPDFDLHRDEFLHLDQANHLAWGYLSVPPLTSWISVIISWLGNSEFWIRFFPALFGALTLVLIWDLVERLGGSLFARSLAAITLLCSALIRLNILFQPNSLDILCFTLVFYTLIRHFQTEKNHWLYILGLSFALGFLNKYTIVFLAAGLLPALLLTKRNIFLKKHLYGALILALFLISPNLIWQIQNGFPVLTHMQLLSSTQLVNNSRIGFLMDQLLFFYPSLLVWVAGLGGLLFWKKQSEFRFVGWTFLFTMGIFTYFQAKGYYAIGLYPLLLAFGAVWISSTVEALKPASSKIASAVILIMPPLLFLPAITLIHPFYSPDHIQSNPPNYARLGLSRWEDGKEHPIPQDFADMLGWSELAALVDSAYQLMPEKDRTLIICSNYGQAGAINFYSKIPELEALTMNADYLYWFDLEQKVDHLILVWEADEKITQREIGFFEEYREIGKVTHPLAREKGTTVHFLRAAKGDINPVLREEVKEEKKVWEERN